MQVESEITINRSQPEVFDYIAHAEYLPEYVTDFTSVNQVSEGEPGLATQYRYRMSRGAEGTFQWTRFERPAQLAWEGPPVKAGPGTMEPAGRWELSDVGGPTKVKLVMAPTPGGLFKLLAPFMAAGMRKGNARALELLKHRLEEGGAAGPAGEHGGAAGSPLEEGGAAGPAGEHGGAAASPSEEGGATAPPSEPGGAAGTGEQGPPATP
jgi:uncharacterized protein YndB with AHSA1/START domain